MKFPRTAMAEFARKAGDEGLMVGTEGNLSVRVKDKVYITPSGVFKKELSPQDIVVLDLEGNVLEGRNPSSEYRMHLALYEAREDITAIIHAHPPYTLALDLTGEDFSRDYLAEMPMILRKISRVPYREPGTEELAQEVAKAAKETNVLVLERHGAVTLGKSLSQALNLMLVLEKVCKVILLAKTCKAF
ncbi:class II aldolase/adducin family protein [Thermodesulfatator indicus]